jgi:hypothetical protein
MVASNAEATKQTNGLLVFANGWFSSIKGVIRERESTLSMCFLHG